MEHELPTSLVVLLTQHWVISWDAVQEAYTVIPCASFMDKQSADLWDCLASNCSLPEWVQPHPSLYGSDRSAVLLGAEFPFTACPSREERWSRRMKSQTEEWIYSCRKWYTICAQLTVIRCAKKRMWWGFYSVRDHLWQWNCLDLSLNCFMVNSNFGCEGVL